MPKGGLPRQLFFWSACGTQLEQNSSSFCRNCMNISKEIARFRLLFGILHDGHSTSSQAESSDHMQFFDKKIPQHPTTTTFLKRACRVRSPKRVSQFENVFKTRTIAFKNCVFLDSLVDVVFIKSFYISQNEVGKQTRSLGFAHLPTYHLSPPPTPATMCTQWKIQSG